MKDLPKHLAIIPDGNRRWAKNKGLKSFQGINRDGLYQHLTSLFEEIKNNGIRYFSLWAFSTENWKRPKEEIQVIFEVLLKNLIKFKDDALVNEIKFLHIGRKDRIPKKILRAIEELEEVTKKFGKFNVLLCIDYGGRDEIIRAVNKAIKENKQVNEEEFENYLDTKDIPDVDFIIRTSGEKRISGLMSFQGAYAELYFSEKYFPDFNVDDLRDALEDFSQRKRNYGR